MGQQTKIIINTDIVPWNNRQHKEMEDTWSGTALSNGYTILKSDNGMGEAIKELVMGYGLDTVVYNNPPYNDPATFGGQSTPVTPWLSPAQDDSWAPRYQVSPAVYQETTQVPSQSVPLMTHVYALGAHSGIWRIAYVIDNNSFVVWDPQQTATITFDVNELMYMNQNMFPATKVQFVTSSNVDTIGFGNVDGNSNGGFAGPCNIEFGPNQEGIVEPFIVYASGSVMATVTY